MIWNWNQLGWCRNHMNWYCVKSNDIEVTLRRPACLFEKSNVAISRRISDRWRLIGAGIIG